MQGTGKGGGRNTLSHNGETQGMLPRTCHPHSTDGRAQQPRVEDEGVPKGVGNHTKINSHIPGEVQVGTHE